ncbi:flavin reductase family protein [Gordonia desulfuricans]|uniref:Flavin reductase family protein n=1 Tax=Gordonia desulfuricans TaxID=89051 RepID=A0A7K3LLY9_9ACTN|nr:flavin reductase family protein [Gordonia desulfuricans]NDK89272.1 flavin reductase family protein [Gordonia desulfuricans]
MNERTMRSIFGQFASGVTVITCTDDEGETHGATVTAFTVISLEPRLCQVTLTRRSPACGYLHDAPFAVNILSADQLDTAMHFAGKPRVPGPEWSSTWPVPALTGNAATLICNPWASYDGGDHIIFVGEIVDAHVDTSSEPLLFYRSKFHDLGETTATAAHCSDLDDPHRRWFGATARFTPTCVPIPDSVPA